MSFPDATPLRPCGRSHPHPIRPDSVVRSIELIVGMKPLTLNDALGSPMCDGFTAKALNTAPVTAIPTRINPPTATAPPPQTRSGRTD